MSKKLNKDFIPAFIYLMYQIECKNDDENINENIDGNDFEKKILREQVFSLKTFKRIIRAKEELKKKKLLEKRRDRNFYFSNINVFVSYLNGQSLGFESFARVYKSQIKDFYENNKCSDKFLNDFFGISNDEQQKAPIQDPKENFKNGKLIDKSNSHPLKTAIIEIIQYSNDSPKTPQDQRLTNTIKENVLKVYTDYNILPTPKIEPLTLDQALDKNLNGYDLIFQGKTIKYTEEQTMFTISYKIPGTYNDRKDYQKNIEKKYDAHNAIMLIEGELPLDIQCISLWVLALDQYFKGELENCLEIISELERKLMEPETFIDNNKIGLVEILFIKGVVFMFQNKILDALRVFYKIEKEHKNYLQNNLHILSKLYHNLGILERVKGSPQKALDHFCKAIKNKEEQWQSYWELGRMAIYKEKKEKEPYTNVGYKIEKDYNHYYTKAIHYSELDDLKKELEAVDKNHPKTIIQIEEYIEENTITRQASIIKGDNS
ncbi:hypothetical protein [Aquimarina megaterium]|uniref:hypothetical protein n=1 Tax=Aquimarina megaterium TaxID=1443666 RepID=UPI00046F38E2|nr:hypothetical protein [Aquimarina megaterium]